MSSNLDRFKKDLKRLSVLGQEMLFDLAAQTTEETDLPDEIKKEAERLKGWLKKNYQRWFTEALVVIKQLIPDRLTEFVTLYQGDGKRKQVDILTYNIQDWLNGIRPKATIYEPSYDADRVVSTRLSTQVQILESAESRFESSLFDMRQLVQADLLDSELDAARELLANGFVRGAGAIVGVVIEKHLAQVCINHKVSSKKQHPTISDFNDLLKKAEVLDVPTWRQIQRLGDLRNLCDHNKQREPTKDEVIELIDSTAKVSKTLF